MGSIGDYLIWGGNLEAGRFGTKSGDSRIIGESWQPYALYVMHPFTQADVLGLRVCCLQ